MRRLTFISRGGTIELAYDQQVDMLAPARPVSHGGPPNDPGALTAAMAGISPGDGGPRFWYELRDASDNVVLQHPAPDPMVDHVEVFPEDPSDEIQRIPDPRQDQVFTVLLPEIDEARVVRLMRAPATSTGVGLASVSPDASATEVARFTLETD